MQHLDEGTIHTWLDGQLPRDEAAAVEAHVAECRPCADTVAEARGFIAASSRILTALDGVPREVATKQPLGAPRQPSAISLQPSAFGGSASVDVPVAQPLPHAAARRAQRRWFRGPSLAAAAMIVVAVGTFAVVRAKDQAPVSATAPLEIALERPAGPSPDSAAVAVPAPAPMAASAANE